MGTLYLVRHGQASFGAADYDQLSPLGARQCAALGTYLQERGRRFEAVYRGTLRRHAQSLAALSEELPGLPAAEALPALNEYQAEALVHAAAGGQWKGPAPGADADDRREHFRLLREGLLRWMRGELQPEGMPSWAEFRAGVVGALETLRARHRGDVLVVSSGGPISTAVAHVLDAPASAVVSLNLQMRNSAVTELTTTARGHMLVSYNTLPHLDDAERAGWVTYS